MANKRRKEIYILVVIVVALLILLLLPKKNSVNYELPKLKKVSAQEADKIIITHKNIKKEFLRKGSLWKVNSFKGNKERIQELLNTVINLKIIDMVSQSGNYLRYGLDDKDKISLEVLSKGGNKLLSFFAGALDGTYGSTYIILPNDKKVYKIRGSLKDELIKDIDYWRDKSVLKFDKKSLLSIDINYKDLNFTLFKEKEKWFFKKNKTEVKQELIKDLLSLFSDFKCDSFLEDINGTKDLNDEERYVFNFKDKKKELKIFNSVDKKSDKLLASSSEEEFPFFISKTKGDKLLKIKERIIKESKGGVKK